MVSMPTWTKELFTQEEKEEILTNDGWSTGLIAGPDIEEPQLALVEHFTEEFSGEARVYFFEEEREQYAYETEDDRPEDSSALYVVSYENGEMSS